MVHDQILVSGANRPDYPDVVVVISEGTDDNSDPILEAQYLKRFGACVIAIAIDTSMTDAINRLTCVSSEAVQLIEAGNSAGLMMGNTVMDQLTLAIADCSCQTQNQNGTIISIVRDRLVLVITWGRVLE